MSPHWEKQGAVLEFHYLAVNTRLEHARLYLLRRVPGEPAVGRSEQAQADLAILIAAVKSNHVVGKEQPSVPQARKPCRRDGSTEGVR